MAGRQLAVPQPGLHAVRAAAAAGACWRHGSGSCRPPGPPAPGCGRSGRSAPDRRPPPRCALRSARWTFSMMAISSASASAISRTTTGTSCSLAICAARQRRSPATISIGVGLPRRAAPGWADSMPFSRIDAARSASASSAKVLRGWKRFGLQERDRQGARVFRHGSPRRGARLHRRSVPTGRGPSRAGDRSSGGVMPRPAQAFALDQFARELDIGLAAGTAQIIDQRRQRRGWALRKCAHCAESRWNRPFRPCSGAHRRRPGPTACCACRTWSARCPGSPARGLRLARTSSMVLSSWLKPSSAKNSHCSGTITASAAAIALTVSKRERRRTIDQHIGKRRLIRVRNIPPARPCRMKLRRGMSINLELGAGEIDRRRHQRQAAECGSA